MKPATPLPWRTSHPMKIDDGAARHGLVRIDAEHSAVAQMVEYNKRNAVPVQDASYIAHAANAYPKLIKALRDPRIAYALGYVAEFSGDGGDHTAKDGDKAMKAQRRIDDLLRELGEV